jgi:hypothetical protein
MMVIPNRCLKIHGLTKDKVGMREMKPLRAAIPDMKFLAPRGHRNGVTQGERARDGLAEKPVRAQRREGRRCQRQPYDKERFIDGLELFTELGLMRSNIEPLSPPRDRPLSTSIRPGFVRPRIRMENTCSKML